MSISRILLLMGGFFVFIGNGKAQTQQGVSTIGTDMNLGYSGFSGYNAFQIQIHPNVATFIGENLMTGVKVGLDYSVAKYTNSKYKGQSVGLLGELFTREYYPIDNGRFGLFLTQSIGIETFSNRFGGNSQEVIRGDIRPGVYVFISARNALELSYGDVFITDNLTFHRVTYGAGLFVSTFQLSIRHFINALPQKTIESPKRRL